MNEEEKTEQPTDDSQPTTGIGSVNCESKTEPEISDQTSEITTSEIENMEVHHHPDLHHKKKDFKEYFLEFLMIFLAVTMGFFAENIRENLSNHSKEKEYISNIKKDLVADTAGLNDFLPNLISRVNQTDTLIKLLQINGANNRGSDMYYLARLTTKLRSFPANNTTLTEMEHSGNFRLITKEPVLKGLIKMQKIVETYKVITSLDEQEAEMTYPFLGNLFDASVFNTMESASHFQIDSTATAFANIEKPAGNPQLRNHNADAINQLIFDLLERNGSFTGEVGILKALKTEEIKLINTINKEYHLENE